MTEPVPDLAAIRARAEDATPGLWMLEMIPETSECRIVRVFEFFGEQLEVVTGGGSIGEDAEFIAHARTDIPALLARIDALEGEKADAWDEGYTRGFCDREVMHGEVRDASEGPSVNPYRASRLQVKGKGEQQ